MIHSFAGYTSLNCFPQHMYTEYASVFLYEEMVVVHADTDFLDDITTSLGEYVREELNVRNIVPCSDLLKHASLRAGPDYSGLGKKLGKAMGLVAKEVKAMTQAQILEFQKAGGGTFAGQKLGLQDIKVINDFKAPDGIAKTDIDAARDGEVLVVLDLRLDESLLEAGFAREVRPWHKLIARALVF